MISLQLAPIVFTKEKNVIDELTYEYNNDFEEIKKKYSESYLFKSGIDYGIVYFVLKEHGVLHIRVDAKSEHVYNDLVEVFKEEFPNAVFIKLLHSL